MISSLGSPVAVSRTLLVPVMRSPALVIVADKTPDSVTVGEQTIADAGANVRFTSAPTTPPVTLPDRVNDESAIVNAKVPDKPGPL